MNLNTKEDIKNVLQFINAHRDGCTGQFVQEHFGFDQEKQISILKQMFDQKLIGFANVADEDVTDNDLVGALILITGGYSHPDYSHIF